MVNLKEIGYFIGWAIFTFSVGLNIANYTKPELRQFNASQEKISSVKNKNPNLEKRITNAPETTNNKTSFIEYEQKHLFSSNEKYCFIIQNYIVRNGDRVDKILRHNNKNERFNIEFLEWLDEKINKKGFNENKINLGEIIKIPIQINEGYCEIFGNK